MYRLFLVPVTVLLLVLTVYPILFSVYVSMTNLNLARPGRPVLFIGLTNYINLFSDGHYWLVMKNTLIFLVGAVGTQMVLGFLIALILDRAGIRGIGVVRTALMLPIMITPVIGTLTWLLMFAPRGVINHALSLVGIEGPQWLADPSWALFSLILVDIWQWTPFVIILLLAGLYTVPKELYEAAQIDGASSFAVIWNVVLPLLKPLMGVVVLMRSMDALKVFDKVYILTQGGPGSATEMATFYAYRRGFGFFEMGPATAVAITILLAVLVLSTLLIYSTQRGEWN